VSGFSLIRTNSDAYAWRCNSCLKEYTNAHEAEDCCLELGDPDKLSIVNDSVKVSCLESSVRALEAERDRLKGELKSSNEIREAEKQILINEIEMNKTLRTRHAGMVKAEMVKDVVRFIDNDSFYDEGWKEAVEKLKAALSEVKVVPVAA
jgi:hypothetical protein